MPLLFLLPAEGKKTSGLIIHLSLNVPVQRQLLNANKKRLGNRLGSHPPWCRRRFVHVNLGDDNER